VLENGQRTCGLGCLQFMHLLWIMGMASSISDFLGRNVMD
jgi:hypothetical protein